MNGLLEKDIRIILRRKQVLFLFVVIMFIMGFSSGAAFAIGFMTFLAMMLAVGTISYDEMDQGYVFLLTLPITKAIYVREKYIFCILVELIALAVSEIASLIIYLVTGNGGNFSGELTGGISIFPFVMMFMDFMIPFQLKYGLERSRIALACVAGLFATAVLLGVKAVQHTGFDALLSLAARINALPEGLLLAVMIVIAAVLTVISAKISRNIMEKKEY